MRTRTALIGGGLVLALAAGGTVAGIALTGTSYAQPWCGSVEAAMNNTHQSPDAYLAELQAAGPPAAQLQQDETAYAADQLNVSSAVTFPQVQTAMTAEGSDLRKVGADLRAIDRECGVPVSAANHQAA